MKLAPAYNFDKIKFATDEPTFEKAAKGHTGFCILAKLWRS